MRAAALLLGSVAVAGCGGSEAPRLASLPPIDLVAARAVAAWEDLEPLGGLPRRRDPRTGIVFVRVPAGEFTMGGVAPIDTPRHRVRITRPFWIAETEVTAGQWRTWLRRDGGSGPVPAAGDDPELPAGGVSWNDAMAFCATYGYALPTEAQWEYACRGGASEGGAWEDRRVLERGATVYPNADGRPWPVRSREANAFGLHDMLGNLWEWCADGYLPAYPVADPAVPRVDPVVPAGSGFHVVRGGSWFSVPVPWPSDRQFGAPDHRSFLFGFRVVRAADGG